MRVRTKRILFYLVLALVCYAIGFAGGGRAAFMVFLIAGMIGELLFWKELIWPSRS